MLTLVSRHVMATHLAQPDPRYFLGGIPNIHFPFPPVYNSYGGVVLAAREGELIAEALGPYNKACILRNHGLLTVGHTVDEAAFLFLSMEHACQGQLLAEAAAANGLAKVLITDQEAQYVYKMESEREILYQEFQAYYEYEDEMLGGVFKK